MNKITKIITVSTIALLMTSCASIGDDKYKHAAGSAAIGFGVNFAIGGAQQESDPHLALAACMTVGLAKEIYDEYDYGGFDPQDLIADGVGCVAGVVVSEVLRGNL